MYHKIIYGNCIDELRKIDNQCVNVIFADPPFNVGKFHNDRLDVNEYYTWCEKWIGECFRVLKSTGTFYLMTLTRHLEKLYPILSKRGVFINEVHWRNVSSLNDKRRFWGSYQPIIVYGKTDKYIFNINAQMKPMQFRWDNSQKRIGSRILDIWDDIPRVYAGSIYHKEAILEEGTNKKAHPTQMPIGLARRAILFSSNEDDLVLDPFVGIGTTLIAAIQLKRNSIGIEIRKEWCEDSFQRLQQEVRQTRLDTVLSRIERIGF